MSIDKGTIITVQIGSGKDDYKHRNDVCRTKAPEWAFAAALALKEKFTYGDEFFEVIKVIVHPGTYLKHYEFFCTTKIILRSEAYSKAEKQILDLHNVIRGNVSFSEQDEFVKKFVLTHIQKIKEHVERIEFVAKNNLKQLKLYSGSTEEPEEDSDSD